MKRRVLMGISFVLILLSMAVVATGESKKGMDGDPIRANALRMLNEGREIFRFDTFGDEAFWGETLQLHQAIAGSKLGGVGDGVSPKTALAVGLKVDMDALPKELVASLKAGKVNLDDPATTLALLKLDSVVGVKGVFDKKGALIMLNVDQALEAILSHIHPLEQEKRSLLDCLGQTAADGSKGHHRQTAQVLHDRRV